MKAYGSQSMAAPLKRVLMRSAGSAMRRARAAEWHYGPGFDPAKAAHQHEELARLVTASGATIEWLTDADDGLADSVFTHDPSLTERTSRTVIISDGELVDETVARALPLLNHRQMLAITKKVERIHYQPGAAILHDGRSSDYFYMIANGSVEVELKDKRRTHNVRLQPGQFFGEVELAGVQQKVTSVHAADDAPVELLALHHNEFLPLLQSSPLTQEALARIVADRVGNG